MSILLRRFCFLLITIAVVICAAPFCSAQAGLVISQIYGGGGNSAATYSNDFIELYNPTTSAISLGGLSVQYASATGTSWNAATLPALSLASGHFYLIQAAAGSGTYAALPAPDLILTLSNVSQNFVINLSATAGKVALVSNTTPLTVACPTGATILDFVGYGATANCSEGNLPAPTTTNNTQSIIRTIPSVDSNVNAADFSTASPPNPRNSTGSITGPVIPPVLAIHTIQGVKSTTAMAVSPYAGQQATTSGVVTAVLSNGFFIQARDSDADANLLTPEGIEVFTGSAPSAIVLLGNIVTVTGTVQTYPAVTASHTPATEITSPAITLVSTGNPLPTPIALTTTQLTPSGGLYQLTPYEGMRVSIASVTAVSGTNGSITSANEAAEQATSAGYFYGVITGTPRPFREPGVDIRDPLVPGTPAGVAHFDDNPERILVDSILAGGTSIETSTGAVLTNVTGVLDFTFSSDAYYDPSRLILDAAYSRGNVTAGITVQPAPLPASNEFVVASFNIERFFNPAHTPADDLYYVPAGVTGYNGTSSTGTVSAGQVYISEAVDLTAAAYSGRLQKLSLAIRNVLNLPDIVTLEEVENQNVANDIAAKINGDAGIANLYTAYSTDNSAYYSQDGTGISVGFLVKNTVDKLGFTQYGQGESFTPISSTNPITLNDRPWLVLNAGIKRANSKDYPVTVIVNHMKALTGENSTTSTSTRQKKELQAEDIARYIQTRQAAGQHVISGGDFNAFEFSDGYTDTLATYTNTNVLPATQIVQPGVAGLVTPPLTDLALNLPAAQRWSYVEDGNAQILDHIVVTADLAAAGAHLAYAHLDSDFPLTAYNDITTPARTSDHDAAVGYFVLPAPVLAGTLTPSTPVAFSSYVGVPSTGQVFTFSNTGEGPVIVTAVTTSGDYAVTSNCVGTLAINSSCTANVVLTPTAAGMRAGTLTLSSNVAGGAFTRALSGTGIDFTIADTSGSASTSLTLVAGNNGAISLVVASTTGFTGTASLTCASTQAPAGVTCLVPPSVAIGSVPTTLVINFSSAARTFMSGFGWLPVSGWSSRFTTAMLLLSLFGLLLLPFRRIRRFARLCRMGALFALSIAVLLPFAGCGSSGSSSNANGTPAGTYTYTVTATSGTLTHTETVNLTIH